MVNWKAFAEVERLSVQSRQSSGKLMARNVVFEGSLAACARYIRKLPKEDWIFYSIVPSLVTGLTVTSYSYHDIEALVPPAEEIDNAA